MKIIFFRFNPSFRLLFVLSILVFYFSGNQGVEAQSLIYKSDGTVIRAMQLSKHGKSRSYKLPTDSIEIFHYISLDVIDSIRYEDGKTERFHSKIILPEPEIQNEEPGKNSIGINIWPLFYSSIDVFYERLIANNKFSIKNYVLINTSPDPYPHGFYNSLNFCVGSGINRYFLESDIFRFGTGISFLVGQFNEERYDYNDTDYTYTLEKKIYGGLYINCSLTYKLNKKVFTSVEFDIPIFWKQSIRAFLLKTEIAVNF